MEQYIKSLQDLSTQLKDTLAEQKQLIDKLKWVVNYFGDIIIEEKIANEIKEDLDEDDDDLEKLSEEESEVLP
jgi:hypothetical protein